jgi:hypothetical protein
MLRLERANKAKNSRSIAPAPISACHSLILFGQGWWNMRVNFEFYRISSEIDDRQTPWHTTSNNNNIIMTY